MIHIIGDILLAKNNVSGSQTRDKGNTVRSARVVEAAKNWVGQRTSSNTVFVKDRSSRDSTALSSSVG
jgi:hypothetical protein